MAFISFVLLFILVFLLILMSSDWDRERKKKSVQPETPFYAAVSSGIQNFVVSTEAIEEDHGIEAVAQEIPQSIEQTTIEPITGLAALVNDHEPSMVLDDDGFAAFRHMFILDHETIDDKAKIIKKFNIKHIRDTQNVINFLREEQGLAFIDLSHIFEKDMKTHNDQAKKIMKLLKRTADIHEGDIACLDPGSNLWLVSSGPIEIEKQFFRN